MEKQIKALHISGTDCITDFLSKLLKPADFLKLRPFFVASDITELQLFVPPHVDKADISRY